MNLGERINKIRKEKGISIDELCELSGIPKGTLSKITAGITTNPTLDTVKAIARALGCRLDDFDDFPVPENKKSPSLSDEDEKLLNQYHKLDNDDRILIQGEIRGLLLNEKYRKETLSKDA